VSVLVDSCVWSLALRRRNLFLEPMVLELQHLVREDEACLLGAIRQEVLSGIRESSQFERLRKRLGAFPDLELVTPDHELAAEFFNRCRARGIQGSHTDFLICAVAQRLEMPILTTHPDFDSYARHLPIDLYQPRTAATWVHERSG
jgi:predicted nucleic acid-binding protein